MKNAKRYVPWTVLLTLMMVSVAPVYAGGGGIRADNSVRYIPELEIYTWSVFLVASEYALAEIDSVTYQLHPSYDPPVIISTDPTTNFTIDGRSWSAFEIFVLVHSKGRIMSKFVYELDFSERGAETGVDPGMPRMSVLYDSISVKQKAEYSNESGWAWNLSIDGDEESLASIDRVIYILHPSFEDPIRIVRDRDTAFHLSEHSWDEFNVSLIVVYGDGSEKRMEHYLSFYRTKRYKK